MYGNFPVVKRASGQVMSRNLPRPGPVAIGAAGMAIANQIYELAKASSAGSKRAGSPSGPSSTKKAKVTSTKSSDRTGGTYQGKFKVAKKGKSRRGRKKKYKKRPLRYTQGMTFKREGRGTVSDTNAVYLGGGSPCDYIVNGTIGCIIRELFKQAGVTIQSWSQRLKDFDNSWTFDAIRYKYRISVLSTTESEYDVSIPNDSESTFASIVDDVIADIRSKFGSTTVHEFNEFQLLKRVVVNTSSPEDRQHIIASVDAKRFNLRIKLAQNLMIQNQTKGGLASLADASEDTTESIFANPLYCITYTGKGNGFFPRWREDLNTNYGSFHANPITGLIKTTATLSLPKEGVEPTTRLFIGSRTKRERLEPGAIKQLVNKYDVKRSLNSLLTTLRPWFDQSGNVDRTNMGTCVMIAMEKMLQSNVNENPIDAAFEMNQTIIVDYSYRPAKYINPLVINANEE